MGVEEEHGEGALALRSRLWSRSLREQPPPPPIQQSQVSWDVSSYKPVIPSSLHSPFPNDPSRVNDKRDDINGRRVYGDPESQLLAKFNLNGGRTRSFELPPSSYPVELDNQCDSPGRDGKRPFTSYSINFRAILVECAQAAARDRVQRPYRTSQINRSSSSNNDNIDRSSDNSSNNTKRKWTETVCYVASRTQLPTIAYACEPDLTG